MDRQPSGSTAGLLLLVVGAWVLSQTLVGDLVGRLIAWRSKPVSGIGTAANPLRPDATELQAAGLGVPAAPVPSGPAAGSTAAATTPTLPGLPSIWGVPGMVAVPPQPTYPTPGTRVAAQ